MVLSMPSVVDDNVCKCDFWLILLMSILLSMFDTASTGHFDLNQSNDPLWLFSCWSSFLILRSWMVMMIRWIWCNSTDYADDLFVVNCSTLLYVHWLWFLLRIFPIVMEFKSCWIRFRIEGTQSFWCFCCCCWRYGRCPVCFCWKSTALSLLENKSFKCWSPGHLFIIYKFNFKYISTNTFWWNKL